MLKEIHDDACAQQALRTGSAASEELGKAAMSFFARGICDEKKIREQLRTSIEKRPSRH